VQSFYRKIWNHDRSYVRAGEIKPVAHRPTDGAAVSQFSFRAANAKPALFDEGSLVETGFEQTFPRIPLTKKPANITDWNFVKTPATSYKVTDATGVESTVTVAGSAVPRGDPNYPPTDGGIETAGTFYGGTHAEYGERELVDGWGESGFRIVPGVNDNVSLFWDFGLQWYADAKDAMDAGGVSAIPEASFSQLPRYLWVNATLAPGHYAHGFSGAESAGQPPAESYRRYSDRGFHSELEKALADAVQRELSDPSKRGVTWVADDATAKFLVDKPGAANPNAPAAAKDGSIVFFRILPGDGWYPEKFPIKPKIAANVNDNAAAERTKEAFASIWVNFSEAFQMTMTAKDGATTSLSQKTFWDARKDFKTYLNITHNPVPAAKGTAPQATHIVATPTNVDDNGVPIRVSQYREGSEASFFTHFLRNGLDALPAGTSSKVGSPAYTQSEPVLAAFATGKSPGVDDDDYAFTRSATVSQIPLVYPRTTISKSTGLNYGVPSTDPAAGSYPPVYHPSQSIQGWEVAAPWRMRADNGFATYNTDEDAGTVNPRAGYVNTPVGLGESLQGLNRTYNYSNLEQDGGNTVVLVDGKTTLQATTDTTWTPYRSRFANERGTPDWANFNGGDGRADKSSVLTSITGARRMASYALETGVGSLEGFTLVTGNQTDVFNEARDPTSEFNSGSVLRPNENDFDPFTSPTRASKRGGFGPIGSTNRKTFILRPELGIWRQRGVLPPQTDIRLILRRQSHPGRLFHSPKWGNGYDYVVDWAGEAKGFTGVRRERAKITLWLRRVYPLLTVEQMMREQMMARAATYPYVRTEVHRGTISDTSTIYSASTLFPGRRPSMVLIAIANGACIEGSIGDKRRNMYRYSPYMTSPEHNFALPPSFAAVTKRGEDADQFLGLRDLHSRRINKVFVRWGGRQYPTGAPFSMAEGDEEAMERAYQEMIASNSGFGRDCCITRSAFAHSYSVVVINLEDDLSLPGALSSASSLSSLEIHMELAPDEALAAANKYDSSGADENVADASRSAAEGSTQHSTVTVIAYKPATLTMSYDGNVRTSY
jgi:hypothetical protein